MLDANVLLVWLRQCKVMIGKKQRNEEPCIEQQCKDGRLHEHEQAFLPEHISDIEKEQEDHELRTDHAGQHVTFDDACEAENGRYPALPIRFVFRVLRENKIETVDNQWQEHHGLRLSECIAIINACKTIWIEKIDYGTGISDKPAAGNLPRAVICRCDGAEMNQVEKDIIGELLRESEYP